MLGRMLRRTLRSTSYRVPHRTPCRRPARPYRAVWSTLCIILLLPTVFAAAKRGVLPKLLMQIIRNCN
jgi:hypothetical protein